MTYFPPNVAAPGDDPPVERDINGAVANTGVPAAVPNGKVVTPWFDEYGRQIQGGFNPVDANVDVAITNLPTASFLDYTPATIGLPAVTGALGDEASIVMTTRNYGKKTFFIEATGTGGGGTTGSCKVKVWGGPTNAKMYHIDTIEYTDPDGSDENGLDTIEFDGHYNHMQITVEDIVTCTISVAANMRGL